MAKDIRLKVHPINFDGHLMVLQVGIFYYINIY
jgi:hypothetical protein